MSTEVHIVRPTTTDLVPSFFECLKSVGRERVYIEMVEPPPYERILAFQGKLIETGSPLSYAVANNEVVGWCDIKPQENPRHRHRGTLGMGVRHDYRGRGLGGQLLTHALEQASRAGLEKVELHVYTSNTTAVALYRKRGFEVEGLVRRYRRLDGRDFDVLMMARFL